MAQLNVQASPSLHSVIQTLSHGREYFQFGIIISYKDASQHFLVKLVPTPLDSIPYVEETPLNIKKSIIAEHVLQVNRSLVGGTFVSGFYFYNQHSVTTEQLLPFIRMMERASSLPEHLLLHIGKEFEPCYSLISIERTSGQGKEVSLSFVDELPTFHTFEGSFSTTFSAFIKKNQSVEQLIPHAEVFANAMEQNKDNFPISIDDYFPTSSFLSCDRIHHAIAIYSTEYHNQDQILGNEEDGTIVRISGDYSLFCVALPSVTIEDIKKFIWEDFRRSFLQRMDLMCLYKETDRKWGMPKRMLIDPSPFLPIMLCEYLLPNEVGSDCKNRIQELFGPTLKINACRALEGDSEYTQSTQSTQSSKKVAKKKKSPTGAELPAITKKTSSNNNGILFLLLAALLALLAVLYASLT